MNLLTHILQRDTPVIGGRSKPEVEIIQDTTAFIVIHAYKNSELYAVGKQEFCWLERLGQCPVTGEKEKLAFIANIQENHWVACIVDPAKCAICHGDSLKGAMDGQLKLTLK